MFGIAVTTHSALTLLLIVAASYLLLMLLLERRRKKQQISTGIKLGLKEMEARGYESGCKNTAERYKEQLSRPMSPKKLPPGRYKVEYVLLNGTVPLSAVVVQDVVMMVEGKEKSRTREAWFVSLPYNRRLTQPVPFTLVVDDVGIGYEPYQEPVAPPTVPPKAAEAAA